MKQLGWTSLDQVEQLVKAGLNTDTADMWWITLNWQETKYAVKAKQEERNQPENAIPCWTLGALIGLLPKTIETKKPKNLFFPEILPSNNCVAYTALNKNKEYVFLKLFATGVESDATLIDNMVSMICWLLENNYIKKGK